MKDGEPRTWTRVADFADLREGAGIEVESEGLDLALFLVEGKVYVLSNSCPHNGAALAEGKVDGGEVICPWHNWRFSLEDGICSTLPNLQPAACFPARVREGGVEVALPPKQSPPPCRP